MDPLEATVQQNLGPLHVGIEHAIGLRGTQLPLASVVIPDVAAEHLGLTAEITLGHVVSFKASQASTPGGSPAEFTMGRTHLPIQPTC